MMLLLILLLLLATQCITRNIIGVVVFGQNGNCDGVQGPGRRAREVQIPGLQVQPQRPHEGARARRRRHCARAS